MFWELLREHIGKTMGIIGGLLFGLLYIWVGFFNMVVILTFVAVGFYFGRKYDNREDLMAVLDRILPGKYTKP
jgi:uncharacterized membrane protein